MLIIMSPSHLSGLNLARLASLLINTYTWLLGFACPVSPVKQTCTTLLDRVFF